MPPKNIIEKRPEGGGGESDQESGLQEEAEGENDDE